MNKETTILWQVNPWFVQNGKVSNQCFKPSTKYEMELSTYDGDKIDAEFAWLHHTQRLGLESAGVAGILVGECSDLDLAVRADSIENFEHRALVDYTGKSEAYITRCAKQLKVKAGQRGLLYRPEENA